MMKNAFFAVLFSLISINLTNANPSKTAVLTQVSHQFGVAIKQLEANREKDPQAKEKLTTAILGHKACLARLAQLEAKASLQQTPTDEQRQKIVRLTQIAAKAADEFFYRPFCLNPYCNNHSGLKTTCQQCRVARYCNAECQQAEGNSHEARCALWHTQKRFRDAQSKSEE